MACLPKKRYRSLALTTGDPDSIDGELDPKPTKVVNSEPSEPEILKPQIDLASYRPLVPDSTLSHVPPPKQRSLSGQSDEEKIAEILSKTKSRNPSKVKSDCDKSAGNSSAGGPPNVLSDPTSTTSTSTSTVIRIHREVNANWKIKKDPRARGAEDVERKRRRKEENEFVPEYLRIESEFNTYNPLEREFHNFNWLEKKILKNHASEGLPFRFKPAETNFLPGSQQNRSKEPKRKRNKKQSDCGKTSLKKAMSSGRPSRKVEAPKTSAPKDDQSKSHPKNSAEKVLLGGCSLFKLPQKPNDQSQNASLFKSNIRSFVPESKKDDSTSTNPNDCKLSSNSIPAEMSQPTVKVSPSRELKNDSKVLEEAKKPSKDKSQHETVNFKSDESNPKGSSNQFVPIVKKGNMNSKSGLSTSKKEEPEIIYLDDDDDEIIVPVSTDKSAKIVENVCPTKRPEINSKPQQSNALRNNGPSIDFKNWSRLNGGHIARLVVNSERKRNFGQAGLSGNLSQVGHHQNNGDGGLAEQTSNQISSQKQKSDKDVPKVESARQTDAHKHDDGPVNQQSRQSVHVSENQRFRIVPVTSLLNEKSLTPDRATFSARQPSGRSSQPNSDSVSESLAKNNHEYHVDNQKNSFSISDGYFNSRIEEAGVSHPFGNPYSLSKSEETVTIRPRERNLSGFAESPQDLQPITSLASPESDRTSIRGFYNEGTFIEPIRGSSGESIQDEDGSDWDAEDLRTVHRFRNRHLNEDHLLLPSPPLKAHHNGSRSEILSRGTPEKKIDQRNRSSEDVYSNRLNVNEDHLNRISVSPRNLIIHEEKPEDLRMHTSMDEPNNETPKNSSMRASKLSNSSPRLSSSSFDEVYKEDKNLKEANREKSDQTINKHLPVGSPFATSLCSANFIRAQNSRVSHASGSASLSPLSASSPRLAPGTVSEMIKKDVTAGSKKAKPKPSINRHLPASSQAGISESTGTNEPHNGRNEFLVVPEPVRISQITAGHKIIGIRNDRSLPSGLLNFEHRLMQPQDSNRNANEARGKKRKTPETAHAPEYFKQLASTDNINRLPQEFLAENQIIWNQMVGQGYPGQFQPGHPVMSHRMPAPTSNLHPQRPAHPSQLRMPQAQYLSNHHNNGVTFQPFWQERSAFGPRFQQFPAGQPRVAFMQDHRGVQIPLQYDPNLKGSAGYEMPNNLIANQYQGVSTRPPHPSIRANDKGVPNPRLRPQGCPPFCPDPPKTSLVAENPFEKPGEMRKQPGHQCTFYGPTSNVRPTAMMSTKQSGPPGDNYFTMPFNSQGLYRGLHPQGIVNPNLLRQSYIGLGQVFNRPPIPQNQPLREQHPDHRTSDMMFEPKSSPTAPKSAFETGLPLQNYQQHENVPWNPLQLQEQKQLQQQQPDHRTSEMVFEPKGSPTKHRSSCETGSPFQNYQQHENFPWNRLQLQEQKQLQQKQHPDHRASEMVFEQKSSPTTPKCSFETSLPLSNYQQHENIARMQNQMKQGQQQQQLQQNKALNISHAQKPTGAPQSSQGSGSNVNIRQLEKLYSVNEGLRERELYGEQDSANALRTIRLERRELAGLKGNDNQREAFPARSPGQNLSNFKDHETTLRAQPVSDKPVESVKEHSPREKPKSNIYPITCNCCSGKGSIICSVCKVSVCFNKECQYKHFMSVHYQC